MRSGRDGRWRAAESSTAAVATAVKTADPLQTEGKRYAREEGQRRDECDAGENPHAVGTGRDGLKEGRERGGSRPRAPWSRRREGRWGLRHAGAGAASEPGKDGLRCLSSA